MVSDMVFSKFFNVMWYDKIIVGGYVNYIYCFKINNFIIKFL